MTNRKSGWHAILHWAGHVEIGFASVPTQRTIGQAFHQQAADEVGRDLLGGAGEEGLGEGWDVVYGYESGLGWIDGDHCKRITLNIGPACNSSQDARASARHCRSPRKTARATRIYSVMAKPDKQQLEHDPNPRRRMSRLYRPDE